MLEGLQHYITVYTTPSTQRRRTIRPSLRALKICEEELSRPESLERLTVQDACNHGPPKHGEGRMSPTFWENFRTRRAGCFGSYGTTSVGLTSPGLSFNALREGYESSLPSHQRQLAKGQELLPLNEIPCKSMAHEI